MVDPIKEAFIKAKQDIFNLQSQIESLKKDIISIKDAIRTSSLNVHNPSSFQQTDTPTDRQKYPANLPQIQTKTLENPTFQHNPTDNMPQYELISHNNPVSIGSRGVPTDRQTHQQTDRHTGNEGVYPAQKELESSANSQKNTEKDKISQLEHVSNLLSSLDSIKKELRSQFKHLTSQEMAVFSCIYDLEDKGFIVDYPSISQKMSLSESSIRDYIQKIIKKGIPIVKMKENNKKILLKIDENLKKIASLQTILTLRQL